MATIESLLNSADLPDSPTPRLDAELLLAAALQIGTTIRMAAFSRRRELGIMRLVGASNWYIMVPFLLESLVAALAGALLACG